MGKSAIHETATRAAGVIQVVDVIGRVLMLRVDGVDLTLAVPRDCPVFLRGERVKFRLLQPGDLADVTFISSKEVLEARAIQVDWRTRSMVRDQRLQQPGK